MRVLFWNTHRNDINNYIASLIKEQNIDLFFAAEYVGSIDDLCKRVGVDRGYEPIMSLGCERIMTLGKVDCYNPSFHNKYCTMLYVNNRYHFCAVHLPSKLHEAKRRECIIRELVDEIDVFERAHKVKNTIIVGDLNVNPYEESCLSVDMFHSIPVDCEAQREFRSYAGNTYNMFYNPMWNLFGDNNIPPGTYYLNSGEAICPYWNIYDQVLIRPSLISNFHKDKLRIITKCGEGELVDEKKHPKKEISDHLPIVFEMED